MGKALSAYVVQPVEWDDPPRPFPFIVCQVDESSGHQQDVAWFLRETDAKRFVATRDLTRALEDALTHIEDPYGPIDKTEATDAIRTALSKASNT